LSQELRAPVTLTGYPDNYRDNDEIFSDALVGGPFVLGYPFFFSRKTEAESANCTLHPLDAIVRHSPGMTPDRITIPEAQDVTCNLERFCRAASASGFFNATPDDDGVLRRISLIVKYDGRYYPNLALATYMEAVNAKNPVINTAGAYPESISMVVGNRLVQIPLDKDGNLLLRYYPGYSFFKIISAADILKNRIRPETLDGRIAFVGSSAPALGDVHPTPLHPLVPGVELHATAADNILRNDFMARPWWSVWIEAFTVLCAGFFQQLC
jgi:adenylate cyclase